MYNMYIVWEVYMFMYEHFVEWAVEIILESTQFYDSPGFLVFINAILLSLVFSIQDKIINQNNARNT